MMEYANNEKALNIAARVRLGLECGAKVDPTQLAPLSLAYIGDTVYDIFVRTMLIETTTLTVHGLHKKATGLVCAKAQARAFERIAPLLNEKELAIFRRGRNSHIGTVPKSASIMDYRVATGLEALVGYLYLSGEDERLKQLMRRLIVDEPTDAE